MNIDACFRLGHIIKKHGLKGEVSIHLDVDFPEDYKKMESVFVEINKQLVPFFIENFQINTNKAIVKFEDVNSIEDIKDLLGNDLYLPVESLPELDKGQFYYHEVIGYTIVDKIEGELGEITQVYEFPNQDLFGMDLKGKEMLIPINDEIVLEADHENRLVNVKLPEGLLDVYKEEE
ncbi:MAG: ribosome maturation factor RimM [Cyclobacteriaceae bacterium]|nr:ribosome maturation factor RimM [Cyclobacteriaceae bacterium]